MVGEPTLLLLREDELPVLEHVVLALSAGLDLGVVLRLGVQLGRETRGPLVIAVSDGAVQDADPGHADTLPPRSMSDGLELLERLAAALAVAERAARGGAEDVLEAGLGRAAVGTAEDSRPELDEIDLSGRPR